MQPTHLFAPPPPWSPSTPATSCRRSAAAAASSGWPVCCNRKNCSARDRAPGMPLAAHAGHHPAKAKSVIWLFMNGGPSTSSTPGTTSPGSSCCDGRELQDFDRDTGFFRDQVGPLAKSTCALAAMARSRGAGSPSCSRTWPGTSTRWPSLYSCWTDSNNHSPALMKINTGSTRMGFPCLGSWVTYGLGSEKPESAGLPIRRCCDTLGRGLAEGLQPATWGRARPSIFRGAAIKPPAPSMDNSCTPHQS